MSVKWMPSRGSPIQIRMGDKIVREKHICEWEYKVRVDDGELWKCKLEFSTGEPCGHHFFLFYGNTLPTDNVSYLDFHKEFFDD